MNRTALLWAALLGLAAAPGPDGGKIDWSRKPLKGELESAAKSGRPLMCYFRLAGDPKCVRMESGPFSNDLIVRVSKEFVCVLVECPDAASRTEHGISGVPAIRFHAPNGSVVDEIVGEIEADALAARLKAALSLASRGWRLEQRHAGGEWQDTHRIILRNGNALDGRLTSFGAEGALLEWNPTVTVKLKPEDILRVELITIRPQGTAVPTFKPPPKPPPKSDSTEKPPPDPVKPPPPVDVKAGTPLVPKPSLSPQVESKIEQVLAAVPTAGDYRQRLRLVDVVKGVHEQAPLYLAWRVETVRGPESVGWVMDVLETSLDTGIDSTLVALLKSKHEIVRARCCAALARTPRAASHAGTIAGMLKDPSVPVILDATAALGEVGESRHLREVADLARHKDEQVRHMGIEAAVKIASRIGEEVDLARQWMDAYSRLPADARAKVSWILTELAAAKPEVDADRVADVLLRSLEDRDPAVRRNVARSLARMKRPEAVGPLCARVDSESDKEVRVEVIKSLETLGDKQAVEYLIAAIPSEDETVRAAALAALHAITGARNLTADYAAWMKWLEENRGR